MARYKSIISLQGSIGDLVFYKLNGVPVVRRKSGFNKTAFKEDESYARVRENSSEFGHCSKAGKMLRNALHPFLKECGDRYLYRSFAKLMTMIKDLDATANRGERTVQKGLESDAAMKLLKNFKFGQKDHLSYETERTGTLFGFSLKLKNPELYDEFIMVAVTPDFSKYTCETVQERFDLASAAPAVTLEFMTEQKDAATPLLYFGVLKREGKIVRMGFV